MLDDEVPPRARTAGGYDIYRPLLRHDAEGIHGFSRPDRVQVMQLVHGPHLPQERTGQRFGEGGRKDVEPHVRDAVHVVYDRPDVPKVLDLAVLDGNAERALDARVGRDLHERVIVASKKVALSGLG